MPIRPGKKPEEETFSDWLIGETEPEEDKFSDWLLKAYPVTAPPPRAPAPPMTPEARAEQAQFGRVGVPLPPRPEELEEPEPTEDEKAGLLESMGNLVVSAPMLLNMTFEKMPEVGAALFDPDRSSKALRTIGGLVGTTGALAGKLMVPGMLPVSIGSEVLEQTGIARQRPEVAKLTAGERAKTLALSAAQLAGFKYLPKLGWVGRRAAAALVGVPSVVQAEQAITQTIEAGGSAEDAVHAAIRSGVNDALAFYMVGQMGKAAAKAKARPARVGLEGVPAPRQPERLKAMKAQREAIKELGKLRRRRMPAPGERLAPEIVREKAPPPMKEIRARRREMAGEIEPKEAVALVRKERARLAKQRLRGLPIPGERLEPEAVPRKRITKEPVPTAEDLRKHPSLKEYVKQRKMVVPEALSKTQILKKMLDIGDKPLKKVTPSEETFLKDVEAGKIKAAPKPGTAQAKAMLAVKEAAAKETTFPTYESIQHKVPPGIPGGLPGEPTPPRSLKSIHASRKRAKMPDAEFRAIVEKVTGGRTKSTKNLTKGEAIQVVAAIKEPVRLGQLKKQPGVKKVLRRPLVEEVEKSERDFKQAIKEVQTHTKVRFPQEPGIVPKLKLRTKVKRAVAGILTRGQKTYEAKVEEIAPVGGKAHHTLVERGREGRSRTAGIVVGADRHARKANKEYGITSKDIYRHSEQNTKFMLPSGKKISAPPAVLADIVGAWSDGHYRRAIQRSGVTFRETMAPLQVNASDVMAIKSHLEANFPKVLQRLSNDINWYRLVGGELMATANWRETGKRMEMRNDYYPGTRDIRHLRGERAQRLTQEAQMKNWAAEEFGHGRKSKVVGLRQEGRAPEPELRGIPILKKRVEAKVPYLAQNIYAKFFTHANRVAQYAGKAEVVRDMKRLLYSPEFQTAIRERFSDGDAILNDLRQHVISYSGLDYQPHGPISRAVNYLARKVTVGALGLKPQIALYQPISYLNAATELPAKHWRRGLTGEELITDAELNKYFPELVQRFEGGGQMIMTPSLSVGIKEQIRLQNFGPKITLGRAGMWPIHKMDKITITKIAAAAKSWARADGLKGEALRTEANKRAMRVIDRTQPTWDPLTVSTLHLEARKSPLKKALVMFTSQANKNLNMAMRATNEYRHSGRTAADKVRLVGKTALPLIINATMIHGIREGWWKLMGYDKERSYVDHISGILSRSYGGYLLVAPLLDNVKEQIVTRLGKKRAAIFLTPRHNPLTEAVDDIPEVVGIWTDVIEKALTGERYTRGPRKGQRKVDAKLVRAIQQTIRASSGWFGLPVAGVEQAVRPFLKKQEKK